MATRFEFVLRGANEVTLRGAGEEALDEIERLEARLSLFQPSSEIARVNALGAREPVRVTPEVFGLLRRAKQLHEETEGAFDVTIAPLVRCWGFMGGSGNIPRQTDLEQARQSVGMTHLLLDPDKLTVRFARPGMMLDLGAIGKGYAIERAAEILREAGVADAFIHGGTSTVYALGKAPGGNPWKVAIDGAEAGWEQEVALTTIELSDEAMSVSAPRGKHFESQGRVYGHILDPRSGMPAENAVLSAVVVPSATDSDALSTALVILGPAALGKLSGLRPGTRTLVAYELAGHRKAEAVGIQIASPSLRG